MDVIDQADDEPGPCVGGDATSPTACLRLEARVAALEAAMARLHGCDVVDAPDPTPLWGTPPAPPLEAPHPGVGTLGRHDGFVDYRPRPPSSPEEVATVCRKLAVTSWSVGFPRVQLSGISWKVLDVVDGHTALLLADRVIGTGPYHTEAEDVTWQRCDLRRWLNEEFCGSLGDPLVSRVALTTVVNEPNPVWGTRGCEDTTDRFFLLSMRQALSQFTGRNPSSWTPYQTEQLHLGRSARARGVTGGYTCRWWLRSPGHNPGRAACVAYDGDLDGNGDDVSWAGGGVRPAFWLNLTA